MEEIIAYKTNDGRIFNNSKDAEEYEKNMAPIRAFKIYACDELCDEKGLKFEGYLLVHAKDNHSIFAEDWCYCEYGNRITFIKGLYNSNSITHHWEYNECEIQDVEEDKIIDRIEDDLVYKIWEQKGDI